MNKPNDSEIKGDEAIIQRADKSVRHRVRLELQIVRKTIRELVGAGYQVAADNGEDRPLYGRTERDTIDTLFEVDEAHLLVRGEGVKPSFVFFVFGNDGYDVVSDYGMSIEGVMSRVNEYATKLEDEGR